MSEGWHRVCMKGGARSKRKIRRPGEFVMRVFDSTCIRFSASLAPSGRLSPWTHWTVLSLSHGSPPPLLHQFSFLSVSFISPRAFWYVCRLREFAHARVRASAVRRELEFLKHRERIAKTHPQHAKQTFICEFCKEGFRFTKAGFWAVYENWTERPLLPHLRNRKHPLAPRS